MACARETRSRRYKSRDSHIIIYLHKSSPLSHFNHTRSWLCCFIDCIRPLSSFILTSILFLRPPRSIRQYVTNVYGSVPFMAGFRTPDSLIAHCMPFVLSCYYRTSPGLPRLCADTYSFDALCIPICGMFFGPLHIVFMCYCLYMLRRPKHANTVSNTRILYPVFKISPESKQALYGRKALPVPGKMYLHP